MGYRLETIKLNNFKAFYGTREIAVERKNLLIYGENGSGKSSLYFALYTLFRAAVEDKNKVKQYFDKNSKKYLGNIFITDATDVPFIEIKLSSKNKRSISYLLSYEENQAYDDKLLKSALFSSDFIDYRQVSRLAWKTMSQDMDIFKDMRYVLEVFPSSSYPNKTMWELYTDVEKGAFYERESKKRKYHKKSKGYRDYNGKLEAFNSEIASIFYGCKDDVNKLLHKFFPDYNIEVAFYVNDAKWDHREGEFEPPKIILKVNYHQIPIDKPHVFLNESRLSAIGIAIRLALIKRRLQRSEFKLLFLDDILLSLDMSNRDQVLQIIMEEFHDYQIIFMTHDRALFEMIKRKTSNKSWEYLEFYIGKSKREHDIPVIKDSKSYLQRARELMEDHDYYASANYLRKEVERIFKEILGLPADYPDMKKITLEKLRQQLEIRIKSIDLLNELKKLAENLEKDLKTFIETLEKKEDRELIGQSISFIGKILKLSKEIESLDLNLKKKALNNLKELRELLESYTQRVLNPASHDNLDEPLYKKELEACLDVVNRLADLKKENP